MILLMKNLNLNKKAVLLCNNKGVLESLSYQQMINISEMITNMLVKSIKEENICLVLLMPHNVYIPSIVLSLQELKHGFIFLKTNPCKTRISIKYSWLLSFQNVDELSPYQEVNRLLLGSKSLILWNRCDSYPSTITFQNIFCVVQSSGTTRDNKLIRVTDTCIETNTFSLRKVFQIKSDDVIFWGTPLTFDPSFIELILALQSGATLVIVPYSVSINPEALYETLFNIANITFLQIVPSLFLRWNEDQIKQILLNSQLRILALGGEHFPKQILSYNRGNNLRIFNLYGISEVSCWATVHEIKNENHNYNIPIGNNLDETVVQLRNEVGTEVEYGKGEIYIGSTSRICYVDKEEPLGISGMVFRETGDIAEITEKGIFLIGRKNRIIKRFGCKINLTKMESRIFEEIGLETRCIWSEKNKQILTFILMKNFNLAIKEKILDKLRIKLIDILPEDSYPDFIDIVNNFPLTCHGKVNEKVLEELYSISKCSTSFEDTFRLLWCRYTGISSENLIELQHLKFFEMGGNSISAIQLLSEFKAMIKCDYPQELVTMMYENSYKDCLKSLEDFKPLKTIDEIVPQERVTKKRKMNNVLEILWSHDLKACIDSSPLVFLKKKITYIAIGSFSHKFIVFHENDQVVYEVTLPDSIESTPSISPCENFILVGCLNGTIYCMDFVKKEIVWQFATASKIKGSVSFSRNRSAAIFGSYDKHTYCVSIMDGSRIWSTLLDGSISSNPVYNEARKAVFTATTQGTCFCLKEQDGQIIWKNNCGGPIFGTSCLINHNENVLFPTVQGVLHCFQAENGVLLWKYQSQGHIFSSLVAYKNWVIFGCHDRTVNVLNITDLGCSLVKKIVIDSEISTTPFVNNINGSDVIVAACNSGVINVIDFNTFEIYSSIQLPGEVFSSPVVHNNKIYVGCRDNNFYCIQINKSNHP